ncbi:hypothetical protein FACS189485_18720 [Spirochaetia bacterium]|nr:hypothetical protein FACS189485_18720 [Spirochaetia bacterium]
MRINQRVLLFLLLLCSYNIYAENIPKYSFGITEVGIGYNLSMSQKSELELTIIPINFFWEYPNFFENSKTRIGIEFYPFELKGFPISQNLEMSFINAKLFFDFF